MSDADLTATQEVYAAFNRGDLQRVGELFDPDIEWVEPEGYFLPEGRGTHRGRERVMSFLQAFGGYWSTFRVEPDQLFDIGDGTVIVIGHQRGEARATRRRLEVPFANLWQVRGGLMTKHWSIADTRTVAAVLGE